VNSPSTPPSRRREKGDGIGPTKCGVGSKIAIVVEMKNGLPVGLAVDAANVPETALGPAALAMFGVMLPGALVADRAYDCDWLREHLA
jgi:hypothetical protein